MALYCELDSLKTESDVEQKFIYQFLSSEQPIGLGLKDAEILTKHLLKKRIIDKGQKQQYYYPDYLICVLHFASIIKAAEVHPQRLLLLFIRNLTFEIRYHH